MRRGAPAPQTGRQVQRLLGGRNDERGAARPPSRLDSIPDHREILKRRRSAPGPRFEHKEAKALLRLVRAGDPDALVRARARHPAIDASAPAHIRLADAQLVIAREYGFTSWPRLVRYFGDIARQLHSYKGSILPPDSYTRVVGGDDVSAPQ